MSHRQSLMQNVLIFHVGGTNVAGVMVLVVVQGVNVGEKLVATMEAATLEVVVGTVSLTSLALTLKDRLTRIAGVKA